MSDPKPRSLDWTRYRGFESVPVRLRVRVGQGSLTFARLAELSAGDLVRLDRPLGAPFELVAGGVVLGRVEPVVTEQKVGLKLLAAEKNDDPAG